MTAPEFYCTDCETMMPVDISGRGACGHGRMIRADLAAVQPAQVRVKPLVWDKSGIAETSFGTYWIADMRDYKKGFRLYLPSGATGYNSILHGTELYFEIAKDAEIAAQADHEARVRSELIQQPDPRDEVIARLVEAAEQFLIEYDEVDLAVHEPKSLTDAVYEARAALAAAKAVQHG